jgi:hypothetical protein
MEHVPIYNYTCKSEPAWLMAQHLPAQHCEAVPDNKNRKWRISLPYLSQVIICELCAHSVRVPPPELSPASPDLILHNNGQ